MPVFVGWWWWCWWWCCPSVEAHPILFIFSNEHVRNNLRTEDTFLAVQMLGSDGVSWVDVAIDGNWETKFEWNRPKEFHGESFATIVWAVPLDTTPGTYRIQHYNSHKSLLGKITEFTGTTNTFKVTAAVDRRTIVPVEDHETCVPFGQQCLICTNCPSCCSKTCGLNGICI